MTYNIFGETNRLILRKMSFDDFDEIAQIMRGENVQKIWGYYFSENDINDWINKNIALYEKYNMGFFIAIEKETKNIIGQIAIKPDIINGNNIIEIGYILKEEYTKQGYATEGAEFMTNYAFTKLNLNHVIFEIRPINTDSINVAKRLGAKLQGQFIKNVRGKDMEHYIFTLTK